MDTGRGILHSGACQRVRARGGIALGEISDVDDGVMNVANHRGKKQKRGGGGAA